MQLKNTLNPKTASVKQRLYKAFKSYSEVTTGHGIYYVFEQTGNIVTQITWILIIFLFIILGFLFCKEAYEDWQNNPVLTTLEITGLKVEEIDFPAITLCNQGNLKDIRHLKLIKTDLGLYCDSYDGVVFDITSMKDIQTIMDIQKIWNELNEFYVDLKIDEQELESYTSPYGISLRMNDTLGNCIAVNIKRTISFIRKKCSETLSLACISRKSCIAAVGMTQSLSWGYPCQITELVKQASLNI
ncbi:ASICN [Lepeophtheirus salmonis]|uniref:ASICN n=1 Tax=Lepeophtheirus salmonis TaxID=72036 RepID=A0A7R8H1I9_LEPSM|nr:ASICN [Lepeophtheirus salmonis]CAF2810306.1 ASICN [Lepeophtheirus salmonis]